MRLKHHFHDDNSEPDNLLIKLKSSWTPSKTKNDTFEDMIRKLYNLTYKKRKNRIDNIKDLRDDLNKLILRAKQKEIIIKKADKGSIVVIMSPEYYLDMCCRHLNNTEFYKELNTTDPSPIIQSRINSFAEKYKSQLTHNEHKYITESKYKIANFYMLPKIHKSKTLNEIIKNDPKEYYIVNNINFDGRPIVAGCASHTHPLSCIVHKIMEPCLKEIKTILKDTFDFTDKAKQNKSFGIGTVLCTADISSLYTNISHNEGMQSLSYWIDKLQAKIPLLKRFSKSFVLEAMYIVLTFNYFYIDSKFYHQIKGTAMGTIAAVIYANLHVARIEHKMFEKLPELYPSDFITKFLSNYFRFLDDVFNKWDKCYDIEPLYLLLNSIDPNIKFIYEAPSEEINFLDVKCSITNDNIKFDIYHKPTNSFTYLHYDSCHPRHTKENIALSLSRRIIHIVSEDIQPRLQQLRTN